jgi:hypothetical protein
MNAISACATPTFRRCRQSSASAGHWARSENSSALLPVHDLRHPAYGPLKPGAIGERHQGTDLDPSFVQHPQVPPERPFSCTVLIGPRGDADGQCPARCPGLGDPNHVPHAPLIAMQVVSRRYLRP